MAAAGAPLSCTVPGCKWFTGAALTPEQQTHQLAKHLRDVHATFPRESKLFVLPPSRGLDELERQHYISLGAAQTAPRPSATFDGDTWDEVREAARAWLAEEDARIPTQRPGQEGTS